MKPALRIYPWALGVLVAAGGALGQNYPARPVHIYTSEPGGGNDFAARLIAQGISGPLGQPVIIENRSTLVSIESVAKAPPDGYAIVYQGANVWISPLIRKSTYDPVRDLAPITWATVSPDILMVHPSLPVKSVNELIALARREPAKLNYASSGTGTSGHISAELFKSLAGVDIVRINYKGNGPAVNDLIGGQVQVMFASSGTSGPHIKSGRVRALAVTTAKRSALFPDLPTIAASGVPGYDAGSTSGVFAPAKTPDAVIARLNREIVQALNSSDVKEKFLAAGVEVVASTPEELAARVKSDTARLGKVIREAGIHED
jgi:tripartite-type tricarboxylate transporter receptor subunit TctC